MDCGKSPIPARPDQIGDITMIIDCIDNDFFYYGVNKLFITAFKFLKEKNLAEMEPGKYEIDWSNIYALVQSYETNPEKKGVCEAHRRYIDIQYLVSGTEMMGCANLEAMTVCQEYTETEDCLLLKGKGNFFLLEPKNFVVFMPQDVHMPGLAATNSETVKKIVVKVRI